jgi:PAS domain S-box-containing protein
VSRVAHQRSTPIATFLSLARAEIIDTWTAAMRRAPPRADEVLDQIGDLASRLARGEPIDRTVSTARRYAFDRLGEGFDAAMIVEELSRLRFAVWTAWDRRLRTDRGELRAIDAAIDAAITASVERYEEARARTLEALDQISTAALEADSVPALLHRLLSVFRDTTPAVDTAEILLVENGRLQVKAAVGLGDECRRGFSLAIGEGFAGTIAARREPLSLRNAATDPLVLNETIRKKGVRAIYGVPLVQGDELLGVAHMGSLVAYEFSIEDRFLFRSMVSRATVGIRQQLLSAGRERVLAKLESLLAASPVGIAFLDRDLRYLRINDALAAWNGRPAAEHIGRTVAEVLPDAAPAFEPMLRNIIATGTPVLDVEVTSPVGDRSLLANFFPVRSPSGEIVGVGGVVTDVTDARRAAAELRREQLRVQSIVEHAPAAIWVKDAEGRIVLANHRLADALGHKYEDVIGHTSEELLPAQIAAPHIAHDATVVREHRAIEVEETLLSPEGPRTFLSIKFPIPGDPPMVGGIATEITQRKQMEDQLRLAVRARDNVLAVVSHDLRNPLGTIKLSASTLGRFVADQPRAKRALAMVERSCDRMDHLIGDLLDMASISAGRLAIETLPERAEEVAREAAELHRPLAEQKGIALDLVCDVRGVEILCDHERILQVFANLVGNALKFCRPGDTITIGGELDGASVRFSVADTGPGIPVEQRVHLFDPYWSGPGAKGGAGLGLFIARGIVERHGGHITVDTEVDKGTRFTFTIPRV